MGIVKEALGLYRTPWSPDPIGETSTPSVDTPSTLSIVVFRARVAVPIAVRAPAAVTLPSTFRCATPAPTFRTYRV